MNRFPQYAGRLLATLAFLLTLPATAQDAPYLITLGGTSGEGGYSVSIDAVGNTYITGGFEGTVDFDPGTEVEERTSVGNWDVFLASYDSQGNLRFVNTFGGTGFDEAWRIALDDAGNSYLTGEFRGTVDFHPHPEVTEQRTSVDGSDVFLASYDSQGNLRFVNTFGSTGDDVGHDVAVDAAGNSYITGHFAETVDFDPGVGTEERTSSGFEDGFLASYDSQGHFRFASTFGGETWWDNGSGVAVDTAGNSYVTGQFWGTADFDPGTGVAERTSVDGSDVFLASYDSQGNLRFVNTFGGISEDYSYDVSIDAASNSYITGQFWGTADFDPGTGVAERTSTGDYDVFLASYDSQGNLRFVNTFGGIGYDYSYDVKADRAGNSYVMGYFNDTVDFDPNPDATAARTSAGGQDGFLASYDSQGHFRFANTFGGTGEDYGWGVTTDAAGNSYVAGSFQETVDFDPAPDVTEARTSAGSWDAFLASYDSQGNLRSFDPAPQPQATNNDLVIANVGTPNQICLNDDAGRYGCFDIEDTSNSSYDVAVADLDGIGGEDLVFANNFDANRVCLRNEDDTFTCSDVNADANGNWSVAAGDFDGVNGNDLVFTSVTGFPDLCLNDGTGTFACAIMNNSGAGFTYGVDVADLDSDTDLDIAFSGGGENNRVCLNDGTGTFACSAVSTGGFSSTAVVIADLDGVNELDLVFATSTIGSGVDNRNEVCFSDGMGGYLCTALSDADQRTEGLAAGDMNGDGAVDLVFANGWFDAENEICTNDGFGNFTCTDLIGEASYASYDVTLVEADGQAHADLVFANWSSNANRLCLEDGLGFQGYACNDLEDTFRSSNGIAVGEFGILPIVEVAEVEIDPADGTFGTLSRDAKYAFNFTATNTGNVPVDFAARTALTNSGGRVFGNVELEETRDRVRQQRAEARQRAEAEGQTTQRGGASVLIAAPTAATPQKAQPQHPLASADALSRIISANAARLARANTDKQTGFRSSVVQHGPLDHEVYAEDFESVTPPMLPADWRKVNIFPQGDTFYVTEADVSTQALFVGTFDETDGYTIKDSTYTLAWSPVMDLTAVADTEAVKLEFRYQVLMEEGFDFAIAWLGVGSHDNHELYFLGDSQNLLINDGASHTVLFDITEWAAGEPEVFVMFDVRTDGGVRSSYALFDDLAVFTQPAMATVTPTAGMLDVEGAQDFTLRFCTEGLVGGEYFLTTTLDYAASGDASLGGTAQQVLSFTIANAAPIAVTDTITVVSGDILPFFPLINDAILANDGDPDGEFFYVDDITQAPYGKLDYLNGPDADLDGIDPYADELHYIAPLNYDGWDYFDYTISDGKDASAARVWIRVLAEPRFMTGAPIQITTLEDDMAMVSAIHMAAGVGGLNPALMVEGLADDENIAIVPDFENYTLMVSATENWWGQTKAWLYLTDGFGVYDSTQVQIVVVPVNDAPTAAFQTNVNGPDVTFTDGSDDAADPEGALVAWDWDFGDGEGSTEASPVHQYSALGTYTVTLTVTDNAGATTTTTETVEITTTVGLEREAGVPTAFELAQNYPNPFNPVTSIRFGLPTSMAVTVRVFNLLGQEVALLYDGQALAAGYHTVTFDAGDLASGVYLYQVTTTDRVLATKKMVLLK